jgi:imidazolonepropionase-like amidohydrolase
VKFVVLLGVVAGLIGAGAGCSGGSTQRVSHTPPMPMRIERGDFAFTHVNLLGGSGTVVADQTVVVQAGRIVFVGKSSEASVPPDVIREDGGGRRFLVPGLADMHVHLAFDAEHWLPLLLAHGVTTVLNLRGTPEHLSLRDRVRRGDVVGPTIYTAGDFVNEPDVVTPADAERVVEEQQKAGYDVLKIHGNLSQETFKALLAAADRRKIGVTGHVPRNLRFDSVFMVGMRSIAHAEEMLYTHFSSDGKEDEKDIPPFATRAASYGLWVTPTLVNYQSLTAQWGRPVVADEQLRSGEWTAYLHPELRASWTLGNPYIRRVSDPAVMEKNSQFLKKLVRQLHEKGVHLTVGTDAPLPLLVPGLSVHQEMEALRDAGVPAEAVWLAATKNAGEYATQFLGEKEAFGVVTATARADLLVVDENPIQTPDAVRRPRGVMIRGRWLPRAEIDRLLDSVRQRYAAMPTIEDRGFDVRAVRKYVGRYATSGNPFSIRIELKGNDLVASPVGASSTWKLARTGPEEFRTLGVPIRLVFSGNDSVEIFEEGSPPLTLRKTK